jgi:hypothetical protein
VSAIASRPGAFRSSCSGRRDDPGARRITPPGTLTARRGLPAASAAAFLASAAFFAIDGFVSMMLVKTRGLSIGAAAIVITASALAWAAGSWWQSRVIGAWGRAG